MGIDEDWRNDRVDSGEGGGGGEEVWRDSTGYKMEGG